MSKKTAVTQRGFEHFECTRLRALLSRQACTRTHAIANSPHPAIGRQAMEAHSLMRCKGCDVGAEHRRGKASLPAVPIVQLRVERPLQKRWCLACGKQLVPERWRRNYCDLACKAQGGHLSRIERAVEVSL